MLKLFISDIAGWTEGTLNGSAPTPAAQIVTGVSTDTRTLVPGDLFVALRGERYDAHDFVATAKERGAAAFLLERSVELSAPQVIVPDTVRALGTIAQAVRTKRTTRVIGITGSNGKTTVKTLLASILRLAGRTHVNAGNLNNEIGLPLSLLAEPEGTEFAVYEMGAGKRGDIAYLTDIAQPQIGLVNNIAPAHLERMGTLQGVAETKGALYAGLPAAGIAVINADDAFADYFKETAGNRRVLCFGIEHVAEITAEAVQVGARSRFTLKTPQGEISITLPLPARHNIQNALAASAIAYALKIPLATIQEGLANAQPVQGRGIRRMSAAGWTLIDDSYNANPGSTAAAIAALALEPGETWLVLGDMRELGPDALRLHGEIGALAKTSGIARLYTVGELSQAASRQFGGGAAHFNAQAELIAALKADLRDGVCCLVKGSRGSAMDRVVVALLGADGVSEGGRHAA